jgi:hypothetical protein
MIVKKIRTEGVNKIKGYFYAIWNPKTGLRCGEGRIFKNLPESLG